MSSWNRAEASSLTDPERALTWDSDHARRQAQMWLHDRGIETHDVHGPDLEPPAARAH